MADGTETTQAAQQGPAIPSSLVDVEGVFPNEAALQDAVSRLAHAGFDRAELSLPASAPASATPGQGAPSVTTDTDARQARTLATGLAASAAGMAAAGAVIATGGAAALAVGAAAAAGAGAGALSEVAGKSTQENARKGRAATAAGGELRLAVRANTASRQSLAHGVMAEAGALRVDTVRRGDVTGEARSA